MDLAVKEQLLSIACSVQQASTAELTTALFSHPLVLLHLACRKHKIKTWGHQVVSQLCWNTLFCVHVFNKQLISFVMEVRFRALVVWLFAWTADFLFSVH